MKLRYTPRAKLDIAEIHDYIAQGASKNSEFAQMQGAGKFCSATYALYVSRKFLRNAAVEMKSGVFEVPARKSTGSKTPHPAHAQNG
ncbi:MAG: hypothetical protein Q7S46_09775 [Gallionella sp.]|nr:hypothetical protein [Gallionella sp.]